MKVKESLVQKMSSPMNKFIAKFDSPNPPSESQTVRLQSQQKPLTQPSTLNQNH